jgi:hypothetical protein
MSILSHSNMVVFSQMLMSHNKHLQSAVTFNRVLLHNTQGIHGGVKSHSRQTTVKMNRDYNSQAFR